MSALLQVQQVTKTFTFEERGLTVLDNLSLDIKKGEFVTVLGASGCGKSTLLRCVGGFERPDTGSILLEGKPVTEPGPAITMVFQTFDQLFPWRTVRGNITYPLRIKNPEKPKKQLDDIADEYLRLVNLADFAEYYPHQLSGGMKQRAAIARGLALKAEVMLMDEPFASLDAQSRTALQTELYDLWKKTGITVMFVTHNIWEAIILGSRILMLSAPPDNVLLDIQNPVTEFEGSIRTPSDKGFVECWAQLKDGLAQSGGYELSNMPLFD